MQPKIGKKITRNKNRKGKESKFKTRKVYIIKDVI